MRCLLMLGLLAACGGGGTTNDAGPDGTVNDASPDAVTDASDAGPPCSVDASGSKTIIDAIDMSVAANGVCVLRQGNVVVCNGLSPQPAAFPTDAGAVNLVRVEAGYHFYACALDDAHRLWCWGQNYDGVLASAAIDGGGTNVPQLVSKGGAPLLVDDFATGFEAVCAIEHGTRAVYCWGYSESGELGAADASAPDGGPTAVYAPTLAGYTASATARLAVPRNAMDFCLLDSATLVCWGSNSGAQFTTTSPAYGSTTAIPAALADAGAALPITDVTLGSASCAIDANHHLYCWCASPNNVVCGAATQGGGAPGQVPVDAGAYAVSSGSADTCIVDGQRHARCFGYGGYGLGNGDLTGQSVTSPGLVASPDGGGTLENVVRVSEGVNMGCALVAGACGPTGPGSVYCWGNNLQGELGNADAGASSYVPVPLPVP